MTKKTPRKANIELLRIVCMLEITALHYLYWNDALPLTTNTVTSLRLTGSVIESLCVPSVACYVLISGYCDRRTEFRAGRILKLIAQVWFWSVLLHVLCAAAGLVPLAGSIWELATYIFPIMMGHYWFASAFVVVEILAPLLNAGAGQVSRRTFRGVIAAFTVYECVIKTVLPFQLNMDEMGYDFGFFLLLFLMGAYLRIYGLPRRLNTRGKALAGYLVSCGVIALVQITASALHARTGSLSWLMSAPFHYNYLFAVTGSVCLFLVFAQLEIPEGHSADCIRRLSPLTFGVYLIQCHSDLLPRWPGWLSALAGMSADTSGAVVFFLWMAVSVLIVYVVCSAAEAVRRLLYDYAAAKLPLRFPRR